MMNQMLFADYLKWSADVNQNLRAFRGEGLKKLKSHLAGASVILFDDQASYAVGELHLEEFDSIERMIRGFRMKDDAHIIQVNRHKVNEAIEHSDPAARDRVYLLKTIDNDPARFVVTPFFQIPDLSENEIAKIGRNIPKWAKDQIGSTRDTLEFNLHDLVQPRRGRLGSDIVQWYIDNGETGYTLQFSDGQQESFNWQPQEFLDRWLVGEDWHPSAKTLAQRVDVHDNIYIDWRSHMSPEDFLDDVTKYYSRGKMEIINALALLGENSSRTVSIGRKREAKIYKGRRQVFLSVNNVTVNLRSFRSSHEGPGDSGIKKRRHDVVAHFYHYWSKAPDHARECLHSWKEFEDQEIRTKPNGRRPDVYPQRCEICGLERRWREAHARGDATLGLVIRDKRIVKGADDEL